MLTLFRKFLGKDQGPTERTDSSPLQEGVAPLETGPQQRAEAKENPAGPPSQSFICREALLDRKERIAGYRLSLPRSIQSSLAGKLDRVQRLHDEVLLRHIAELGVGSLLGERLAVVGIAPVSLSNPLIRQLPPGTVLMLTPTEQTLAPEDLAPRLDALRAAGYGHGWVVRREQLAARPELLALAARADYAQIEVKGFDGMDIKSVLKSLKVARPQVLMPLRLLASELDTFDEFRLCFQGGFDLFDGQFINSRENWHPPKSDINRLQVMQLLKLVRSGAEQQVIAEQLKREPVLAFKLLRYINSAAMGLQRPADTMNKALLVLGHEKFYRWLSLLLFDIKDPGYRERMLTEQALVRGRLLENLAGQGRLPREKDRLFLLGLFSLLDVLIGQPMADMLEQAKLPDVVQAALLRQPGPYLDALELAAAAEGTDQDELQRCAAVCEVAPAELSSKALEALAWASTITALGEA